MDDGDSEAGSDDEDDLGEGPSTSRQAVLDLLSASGGQGKKTVFVDTVQQGELERPSCFTRRPS